MVVSKISKFSNKIVGNYNIIYFVGTYICSDIIKIYENDSEYRVGGHPWGGRKGVEDRRWVYRELQLFCK